MTLPTFTGGNSPVFQAPGGLVVQIPQNSDLKTQIQTLAAQPGMGYLNELTLRNDVNWQPVKLVFDQWSYKQEGLTAAGAALVAVAVAMATGGAGADLLGSAGTTTTVGGVTTTTYTTAGLMANAALTSLASQASITLINNKGNIGKTLSDLTKSDLVKAAVSAALTAGAMQQIGALQGMSDLAKGGFADKLTFNMINATGRALTTTAINGGSVEDALKDALLGGLVDTLHGEVAGRIKTLQSDYIAHTLAHALAGCVAGAATGDACKDGALGAAIGEVVARMCPPANGIDYSDAEKAKVLAYGKLIAGGAVAYTGGNAQTAITTAETALLNNGLVPFITGLAWLADKVWTTYEVSQDIAAIRDGTKTVEQVAQEKSRDYVLNIIIGNIGRYGIHATESALGKWVQRKDIGFGNIVESRAAGAGCYNNKTTCSTQPETWRGSA